MEDFGNRSLVYDSPKTKKQSEQLGQQKQRPMGNIYNKTRHQDSTPHIIKYKKVVKTKQNKTLKSVVSALVWEEVERRHIAFC